MLGQNRKQLIKRGALSFFSMLLLLFSVAAGGCGSSDTDANNPDGTEKPTLKVGFSIPYTGPAAEKGSVMGNAKLDAIKYINEELGGVNGYQIEVIWRDTKYDSSLAATIVQEMMDKDCLLFTTCASKEMQASMEIANRASFPGFTVFSSPVCTHPAKHIYAQLPDYGDSWASFAKYYMENIWQGEGTPKMALMILQNPTGYGARDAANALAADLGIEIVGIYEHSATITDDTANLINLKSQNPDVVFISSTPQPTSVIIKQMNQMDIYPGVTVGCGHAGFTKALIDLAGVTNTEGIYGVYPTVNWDEDVPGMAKMKEYCLKYHPENYGNMDYIASWSEGLIVAEILRLALINTPGGIDNLTPQAIEEYGIKKLNGYTVGSLQGPVSYVSGDNRLAKAVRVFQISGGVMQVLSDWVEAPLIRYEDFSWFGS
ncbi:ABC transporter substrate-binding protein [Dehalococcoides mccartyi]|uniref:ABC-type branched-chain amino acid transport systems, periplasmic component n=1 Tax=Dehalococcoides mccartyi (strain VS) TaxID=311424 RepID=D2BHZ4_DEHMV|nr:ABC-type branched-chain amino acid transport systems, periplasmic component [Dehalococcoides mccartyi VS]